MSSGAQAGEPTRQRGQADTSHPPGELGVDAGEVPDAVSAEHVPPPHIWPMSEQLWQVIPPLPQMASVSPSTHRPPESQQPKHVCEHAVPALFAFAAATCMAAAAAT